MFESSVAETYSQAESQTRQTILVKLELPDFIETVFVQASIVGYSQVQEIVLRKMCCTHTNIYIVL